VLRDVAAVEPEWKGGEGEEAEGEGFADVYDALLWSVSRLFRDAVDSGRYSGDYATKDNPTVSGVLPHWAVGVDRLKQEMAAETGWEDREERDVEMGRRMLIRFGDEREPSDLEEAVGDDVPVHVWARVLSVARDLDGVLQDLGEASVRSE
jgi:hypothetical protein